MAGVETQHKSFKAFYDDWITMRHVFAGERTLKANSKRYIAPLDGQDDNDYKEFIARSCFENYVKATAKGISGLIFAKNPQMELSATVEALKDNIDLSGNSIIDLAQSTINEISEVGRGGLLVDMMSYDTTGMTVAQVQALNLRPYIKLYTTENIINWDTELINNQNELSLLVLQEVYNVNINMFEREDKVRYRVYSIEENIVICRIFESNTDQSKGNFSIVSESIPVMNGKPLNSIPFIPITAEDLTIEPSNPPLLDLANINLNHWGISCEYRNILHYLGSPVLTITGYQGQQGEEISIGAKSVIKLPDPTAKVYYTALSADGLSGVKDAMTEQKNAMLALGARLLAPESSSQISENTMQMKTAGQRATIIQIADTVSRGIEKALNIISQWQGDNALQVFKLNTDYNLAEMNPQLMTAMFTGNQIGLVPLEDIYDNLKKGEMTKFETFEDWKTSLETQTPLDNITIPTRKASGTTNTETN